MPQSVYPPIFPDEVSTENAELHADQLLEIANRLNKHLEYITGLELDEGEI